jgi:hypothetical protein
VIYFESPRHVRARHIVTLISLSILSGPLPQPQSFHLGVQRTTAPDVATPIDKAAPPDTAVPNLFCLCAFARQRAASQRKGSWIGSPSLYVALAGGGARTAEP